jgi:hypothetical protein
MGNQYGVILLRMGPIWLNGVPSNYVMPQKVTRKETPTGCDAFGTYPGWLGGFVPLRRPSPIVPESGPYNPSKSPNSQWLPKLDDMPGMEGGQQPVSAREYIRTSRGFSRAHGPLMLGGMNIMSFHVHAGLSRCSPGLPMPVKASHQPRRPLIRAGCPA